LGYQVQLAQNGFQAIAIFQKAKSMGEPFDLVILDLTVPGGMGGKETIEKLQEIDPNIKAIVSSGYSSDPIMANYKNYGFSAVISKPYRVRQLSDVVHHVLTEVKVTA